MLNSKMPKKREVKKQKNVKSGKKLAEYHKKVNTLIKEERKRIFGDKTPLKYAIK